MLFKEDRYNNVSIKDPNKDYPEKIEKLEVLPIFLGENDLKIWKTEFLDNEWK